MFYGFYKRIEMSFKKEKFERHIFIKINNHNMHWLEKNLYTPGGHFISTVGFCYARIKMTNKKFRNLSRKKITGSKTFVPPQY